MWLAVSKQNRGNQIGMQTPKESVFFVDKRIQDSIDCWNALFLWNYVGIIKPHAKFYRVRGLSGFFYHYRDNMTIQDY